MIPAYEGDHISIYEWPGPACEIVGKGPSNVVVIYTREDAMAIIDSLEEFLSATYDFVERGDYEE